MAITNQASCIASLRFCGSYNPPLNKEVLSLLTECDPSENGEQRRLKWKGRRGAWKESSNCGSFVKVMVQGAWAVSRGSDSWVLWESCVLGVVLRSRSSGSTSLAELFITSFLY